MFSCSGDISDVLVKGPSLKNVQELHAVTDPEDRFIFSKSASGKMKITLFFFRNDRFHFGVWFFFPPFWIGVVPSRQDQAIDSIGILSRLPGGFKKGKNEGDTSCALDRLYVELVEAIEVFFPLVPQVAVDPDERLLHEAFPMISSISSSVRRRLELFAFSMIASTTSAFVSRPRFSSQKATFDFPLIGPMVMTCSRPKSPAGTPE